LLKNFLRSRGHGSILPPTAAAQHALHPTGASRIVNARG
jgi:hypothetical protein